MLKRFGKALFDFFSSYLFACILLGFLFLLTILGTFAQVDQGLYEVKKTYFNSLFFVQHAGPFAFPLPGAALVLSLLTVNLVLGGLVRIRKSWATLGVMVIHVGIVMMVAAGAVKLLMAEEGHLTLYEGEQSDEYVSYYLWEVAIYRAEQLENVVEYVIPDEHVQEARGDRSITFRHGDLPFEVELSHFVKNCRPMPKGPMWEAEGPIVDGWGLNAMPLEEEAEFNLAGIHATVRGPDGEEERGILWGAERYPWVYETDEGQRWALTLRHTRYEMPFTIVLDDFTRELHPRTGMAKSFMSDVTKVEGADQRELRIQMNEPLREDGLVLFQASWGPSNARPGDPLFSTFAVVENPSDYWPLYSLIVIGTGLLIAFGRKLYLYVVSQAKNRAATAARSSA